MRESILITNIWLRNFGGSELVSVELAEFYAQKNWNVVLYSPEISDPLQSSIKKRVNLKVTNQLPSDLDQFSIIWSHHGILLDKINARNKRQGQLIVSNHMSSYVDLEKPRYDPNDVDLILANSEETKASFSHVEYKLKTKLFRNPSPSLSKNLKENTFSVFGDLIKKRPKCLAVSNHRPLELEAFLNRNIDNFLVYKYGYKDNIKRISPDFIKENNFDFAVCNGKTVQYALNANIPVFLYDQFGGCGWLSPENFEQAAWYNFSGRGFNKFADLKTMIKIPKPIDEKFNDWRFNLNQCLLRLQLI